MWTVWFLCAIHFWASGSFASKRDGPIDTTSGYLPFSDQLDPNYQLKWNFNSTHIVFETRVKANGYVGLGISSKGAMFPADVIIGWVVNGQVHFADRHTTGHFMPAVDASQDWHLLDGSEDGGYTTLTMIRKLDTCDDPQDMPIQSGTSRIIYSYSDLDPASDDSISYHGNNRGTKSVHLLDERQTTSLPADVTTIDITMTNTNLPSKDTTYSCHVGKLPDMNGKHHLIRYEPIIQKGHEQLVHHMILYTCPYPLPDAILGTTYECYNRVPHSAVWACQSVLLAWAIGGTGFNYPQHVGHPLGSPSDFAYYRLEIHYDNPGMRSDFVDNSGLRIYLTKQLRQYDAGALEAGVSVGPSQLIPPYNRHFLSQGFCFQECLSQGLGQTTIKVFANLLHAHLLGVKLRTRIIRNGKELPALQEDNAYDFNFQEVRLLPEERTLKKGDALIVECEYDSSNRKRVTYGGQSTREEMCLSFMLYYPRVPLTNCLSSPVYTTPGQRRQENIWQSLRYYNWSSEAAQDAFRHELDTSYHYAKCVGVNFRQRWLAKLNFTDVYQPARTCGN